MIGLMGRRGLPAQPSFVQLGGLAPGQRETIRVRVKALKTGRYVNVVAVNSSTQQRSRRGKRASARVRVVQPPRPVFTG